MTSRARGFLRKVPNSVLTCCDAVARRVQQFLDDGTVTSMDGKRVKVRARGILVHSDTPGSAELARTVRQTVEKGGGVVTPPNEFLLPELVRRPCDG